MSYILCTKCGKDLFRSVERGGCNCPRTAPEESESPLSVKIVGEELTIRIGINTLAWAARRSPEFEDDWGMPSLAITNAAGFAKDIMYESVREQEDGTTPVHLLLDAAFVKAVENGSEHVTLKGVDAPEDSGVLVEVSETIEYDRKLEV